MMMMYKTSCIPPLHNYSRCFA